MEQKFTEQESMEVITEMINRARNNFNRNMNVAIFWGYLVAATAIGNFILLQTLTNKYDAYFVWLLMFPGMIVSYFIRRRTDRTAVVKTHIDRIISATWLGHGVSIFVFWGLITIFNNLTQNWTAAFLITPIILILLGLSEFVTAFACRARQMKWIAVMFWIGAILCVLPLQWNKVDGHFSGTLYQGTQQLILAVCMIAGFVIPGHVINRKQKKNHV
ncbi:MAG: ANTH domain-containing protein [Tannerella sp.]|jgi:hypothetical protein|nr:ANTH domain-containing protein [Tannerella sp.]